MAAQVSYCSIDVGGTKTLMALFTADGEILKRRQFDTPKVPADFINTAIHNFKKIAAKQIVKSIGLGLPGSLDAESGAIIFSPNLSAWRGFNVASELSAKLKLPIRVDNDANLGALAEANLGAGQSYRTVLYVTISTGVGTGIVIGGQLWPELSKSEGGMIVFATRDQSYKRLEDLVAGPEFKNRFGKYGFDVIDPNIWSAFARDLAAGLFNMITLFTPDIVILGGGMSVHFGAFRKPLINFVQQLNPGLYPMPPIEQAKYVEEAVIYGGYLLAKGL